MKVYVDDNNITNLDDLFQATNSYECWAGNCGDDLEIVSLADYTKQVCEKIREFAYDTFKEFGCFDETDSIKLKNCNYLPNAVGFHYNFIPSMIFSCALSWSAYRTSKSFRLIKNYP